VQGLVKEPVRFYLLDGTHRTVTRLLSQRTYSARIRWRNPTTAFFLALAHSRHSYSSFLPAGLSKERRRGSSQAWSRRSLRLETCRAVGFVGSSWRSRPTRAARIDVPQDTHRPATNPSFNRTNDLGRPSHGTMRLNRLTNYSDVGGHASTIRISRSSSQRVCGFPSLPPRRICHGVARIRRICRN